jgi:hypothetical protein
MLIGLFFIFSKWSNIHSVRCNLDELRIAFCFQSDTLSFGDAMKKLDQVIL